MRTRVPMIDRRRRADSRVQRRPRRRSTGRRRESYPFGTSVEPRSTGAPVAHRERCSVILAAALGTLTSIVRRLDSGGATSRAGSGSLHERKQAVGESGISADGADRSSQDHA